MIYDQYISNIKQNIKKITKNQHTLFRKKPLAQDKLYKIIPYNIISRYLLYSCTPSNN